jgi:hypothetical protein
MRVSVFLRLFPADCSTFNKVAFVADEHDADMLVRLRAYFLHPLVQILEGLWFGEVKDQQGHDGAV